MTTQFEQNIKAIVDSMITPLLSDGTPNTDGWSYIYSTWNEANQATEDVVSFPIVLNLLPNRGAGNVSGNTIRMTYPCLIAFIDKIPNSEHKTSDVTEITSRMIKGMQEFISKINSSSNFENVIKFQYESVGEFDVNMAGVVLNISITEKIGTPFCKIS